MTTTIDWPVTLPQELSQNGFSAEPEPLAIFTPTGSGHVKTRRRFTSSSETAIGTLLLDRTEMAIFRTFWRTTTAGGALSFNWKDPTSEVAKEVKFTETPPRWNSEGSSFRVTFGIRFNG